MRVQVIDPSAFTPPYDHALCAALAAAGADVELVTSRFGYGPVPSGDGAYAVSERFYRWAPGAPGSRLRLAAKLVQHVPDMLAWRRHAAAADILHFQWLTVQPLDVHLLPRARRHGGPRPVLLTAHDVIPREPRRGQVAAQRRLYERVDAVIVHSGHGARRLTDELGVDPARVHVIAHGAFDHLAVQSGEVPLDAELAAVEKPVVLCFGLLRPYKGIDVLLRAWAGITGSVTNRGTNRTPGGAIARNGSRSMRGMPTIHNSASEISAHARSRTSIPLYGRMSPKQRTTGFSTAASSASSGTSPD